MKVELTQAPGFRPFSFTVTAETVDEAKALQCLYVESEAIAGHMAAIGAVDEWQTNKVLEALGHIAHNVLSK
jgi:hypothetical protein